MFRNIKSEANNSPELTDYMTLCGKIGKRRFEIRYRNIPMRPTVRDNGFVAVHIFDNRVVWFSAGKKKDNSKKDSAIRPPWTSVLYIFVGFWLLAHITRDLSQVELVYDRNHYFGLGPIPKLKPKLADTFSRYRNRYPNYIFKGKSSYR